MKSRMTRLMVAALAAGVLALAFASAAFAENSSVGTYSGGGGGVQTQVASGGDPSGPSATSDSGSLPFTGFDVGLALGGGLILLAGGALIARFTPRGERTS
jgi:hypothetical protein